jgi:hypothetical protein
VEVHFPPDLEAKLTGSAAQQGRRPDELLQEVVMRYFEEEARFIDAGRGGEEALQRREYLTHEQVGQRLQRFCGPEWKSAGRYLRQRIWSVFANGSSATIRKLRFESRESSVRGAHD